MTQNGAKTGRGQEATTLTCRQESDQFSLCTLLFSGLSAGATLLLLCRVQLAPHGTKAKKNGEGGVVGAEKGTRAGDLAILPLKGHRPAQNLCSRPLMGPSGISHQTPAPLPSRQAKVGTLFREPADAPEGSAETDPAPADAAPPAKSRSTCTRGRAPVPHTAKVYHARAKRSEQRPASSGRGTGTDRDQERAAHGLPRLREGSAGRRALAYSAPPRGFSPSPRLGVPRLPCLSYVEPQQASPGTLPIALAQKIAGPTSPPSCPEVLIRTAFP